MNIWAKLRDLWHYPHFWMEAQLPELRIWVPRDDVFDTTYSELWERRWYRIKLCWKCGSLHRAILSDIGVLFIAIKRKLLWWQPLRCNGNAGGWRTSLCEWLEDKARAKYEEMDRDVAEN